MNYLAKKLYELRTERGLKQDELAEALGVSRQAVSKWEMGTGVPSLENLKAISEYFSVTIDSLVKEESDFESSTAYSSAPPANSDFQGQNGNGCYTSPVPDAVTVHSEPGIFAAAAINIAVITAVHILSTLVLSLIMRLFYYYFFYYAGNAPTSDSVNIINNYVANAICLPLSFPIYMLLFIMLDRCACPFSKNIFDREKPVFFRYGLHKILPVMLLRYPLVPLIFDKTALNRLDFSIANNILSFILIVSYLLIFTHGAKGLGKRPLMLLLMIAGIGIAYAVKSVVNFYTFHLAEGNLLTRYSPSSTVFTVGIYAVFALCQAACLRKREE